MGPVSFPRPVRSVEWEVFATTNFSEDGEKLGMGIRQLI